MIRGQELLARLGDDASQLSSLQWLAAHGCDADAALNETEALIGAWQDSAARATMLAAPAQLRRRP